MRKKNLRYLVLVVLIMNSTFLHAQGSDATQLFYKMRDRLGIVKDYVADVRMKIDVAFMKVPLLAGKLYFKSPDKLRLERNGGISIMPRKSINLTIGNLIPSGNATVIDAGKDVINGRNVRVIQVVPQGETDIVLTKVWIDPERLLALRTETTTRDNGTVRMELEYNHYISLALPDKVTFVIDVKDYKLPKGVTMDYDDGTPAPSGKGKQLKMKKGRIQITYLNYQVNTGLSDAVFNAKEKTQ